MSEHTPGKWKAGHDDDPVQVGTEDGKFVAMTLGCDESVADQKDYDNARLIAAAPEMLEALEAAQASLNSLSEFTRKLKGPRLTVFEGIRHKISAAISKAKGE